MISFNLKLTLPLLVFILTVASVLATPIAHDSVFTVAEGATYSGEVTATHPNNNELTFSLQSSPFYGTLVFNADGSLSYTAHRQPTVGFNGLDTFSFRANDGLADSNVATVTITITPVNDAPIAQDYSFTTTVSQTYSGTLSAIDIDGDALTFFIVSNPSLGTPDLNADGTFTYTAHTAGEDSFTFRANDGLADSNVATVTITNIPSTFCGGEGTLEDPYQICTVEHLNNVRDYLTSHFVLNNDLDLNVTPYNAGEGWEPIGENYYNAFRGSFDGAGFEITNLYINREEHNNGLFGAVFNGKITNIGITNANVSGHQWTGLLVGELVSNSLINNSYATGRVEGYSGTGGLVGYSHSSIINNSYTNVDVYSITIHIGGLVGNNAENSIVDRSYSKGSVYSTYDVSNFYNGGVGGLVGLNDGTITNSYAISTVTSNHKAGGFVGWNRGTVKDSFSAGTALVFNIHSIGSQTGGFVGWNQGSITNSYCDNDVSGFPCGFIVNSKSSLEMRNISTYENWDIILSEVDLNDGYPYLAWQKQRDGVVWVIPVLQYFAGGEGTLEDPYQISTCEELQNMNRNLTAHYILINDIDCDIAPFNSGEGFEPIGDDNDNMAVYSFRGTFNGQGFTIFNLYINRPDKFNVGLFGNVVNAEISNLKLVDVDISGYLRTGALSGAGHFTTFSNVSSSGVVKGSMYTGGLIGYSSVSTIENASSSASIMANQREGSYFGGLVGYHGTNSATNNSYTTGDINGINFVGGFVGYNSGGFIYNSYATGNVAGNQRVGGFAGQQIGSGSYPYTGGRTYNSYATGNVTAQYINSQYTGGFVGNHYSGFIYNSYATGTVIGREDVGGFAGRNTGEIYNSYTRGDVNGIEYVGGFIGRHGGVLDFVFSTGVVEGTTHIGGLVGGPYGRYTINNSYYDSTTSNQNDSVGRGIPKTTLELKDIATFEHWNISLSEVDENDGYPYLAWQTENQTATWLIAVPQDEEPVVQPVRRGGGGSRIIEEEEEAPLENQTLDEEPQQPTPLSFWIRTLVRDRTELTSLIDTLKLQERIRVLVKGNVHYIGIVELRSNSVLLLIESTPQQIVVGEGKEVKVNVNGDEYYDIIVQIEELNTQEVTLRVQTIHESIHQTPEVEEQDSTQEIDLEEIPIRDSSVTTTPSIQQPGLGGFITANRPVLISSLLGILVLLAIIGYFVFRRRG